MVNLNKAAETQDNRLSINIKIAEIAEKPFKQAVPFFQSTQTFSHFFSISSSNCIGVGDEIVCVCLFTGYRLK